MGLQFYRASLENKSGLWLYKSVKGSTFIPTCVCYIFKSHYIIKSTQAIMMSFFSLKGNEDQIQAWHQLLQFCSGYRDGPAGGGWGVGGLLPRDVAACLVPEGPLLPPAGWGSLQLLHGLYSGSPGSLQNGCRLHSLELRPGQSQPGDRTVQLGERQGTEQTAGLRPSRWSHLINTSRVPWETDRREVSSRPPPGGWPAPW